MRPIISHEFFFSLGNIYSQDNGRHHQGLIILYVSAHGRNPDRLLTFYHTATRIFTSRILLVKEILYCKYSDILKNENMTHSKSIVP
jgi:hypothetical protein